MPFYFTTFAPKTQFCQIHKFLYSAKDNGNKNKKGSMINMSHTFFNNIPEDGGASLEIEMPVGLGMQLAMNSTAMTAFGNLQEQEKSRMIQYIKSARTSDEAENHVLEVIAALENGTDIQSYE